MAICCVDDVLKNIACCINKCMLSDYCISLVSCRTIPLPCRYPFKQTLDDWIRCVIHFFVDIVCLHIRVRHLICFVSRIHLL